MTDHKKEQETYTVRRHIDTLVKNDDSPLPISVIPNHMGINLVAVKNIEWTRQKKDGQLVTLTINFKPDNG